MPSDLLAFLRRPDREDPTTTMTRASFLTSSVRTAPFWYDVDRHGGEVGEHMLTGELLPAGGIVVDVAIRIEKPFQLAKVLRRPTDAPTGDLVIGKVSVRSPMTLGNQSSWPAGRIRRCHEVASGNRTVPTDSRVVLGIDPPGSGGFAEGRLLVMVSYLPLPRWPFDDVPAEAVA